MAGIGPLLAADNYDMIYLWDFMLQCPPQVPCRLYLDTLQRRNFNPFDPVCSRREANLAAKMAWKKFRGAY